MKKINPETVAAITMIVFCSSVILILVGSLIIDAGLVKFLYFMGTLIGLGVSVFAWFWGVPYLWNKIVDMLEDAK